MRRGIATLLSVVFVTTAAAATAAAQETVNFASVSGRVTDPQGAVIPGASVTARHTETNVTATATSDEEGRFRFPYLRIGPYEITAKYTGFADATRALTLTLGAAYEISLSLSLGEVTTTLTVSAQTTVLETARSQIAGTIAQAEVQSLPLNGRNFLDLALLVPGVSPTNIGSTQLFAETSAVPGQGMSVNSQRNLSNGFIVDGLSANDDAAALSGITYSVDAIEQFQIVTSGGQAELGRALGGYVNVVTRSGTNVLQGTAYEYIRDDQFTAANALSGLRLPIRQWQFGGSAGGPIVRDRTFYFGNVEQQRLHQSGLVVIAPYSAADAKGLLKAAIRSEDPVVFLENELLYGQHFDVPQMDDYVLPIGKARIVRPGKDVTIVSYSIGVGVALEAAQELMGQGINAEVIDLRTLRPLDKETVLESLKRTNRMVVVEEGWPVCSISSEIMAIAMTEGFDDLDAPVLRVTDVDVPLPYAANLEKLALIKASDVVESVKAVTYR